MNSIPIELVGVRSFILETDHDSQGINTAIKNTPIAIICKVEFDHL